MHIIITADVVQLNTGSLFGGIDEHFFCRVDEPLRLARADGVLTPSRYPTAWKHRIEYGTFFCKRRTINHIIVLFRFNIEF